MDEKQKEMISGKKRTKYDTQFKIGNPGGPGRPKGLLNADTIRKEMINDTPAIIKRLLQACRKGSIAAMRIWMDRVIPTLSATELKIIKDEMDDDSIYTEEQLRAIKVKEEEIEAIKIGGTTGHESPQA